MGLAFSKSSKRNWRSGLAVLIMASLVMTALSPACRWLQQGATTAQTMMAEICTETGLKKIALNLPSSPKEQPPHKQASREHCAVCLTQASFAPPPVTPELNLPRPDTYIFFVASNELPPAARNGAYGARAPPLS